jgi:hypothetical protein
MRGALTRSSAVPNRILLSTIGRRSLLFNPLTQNVGSLTCSQRRLGSKSLFQSIPVIDLVAKTRRGREMYHANASISSFARPSLRLHPADGELRKGIILFGGHEIPFESFDRIPVNAIPLVINVAQRTLGIVAPQVGSLAYLPYCFERISFHSLAVPIHAADIIHRLQTALIRAFPYQKNALPVSRSTPVPN